MIRALEFSSERPGPHLLIFGAIHGNEICGTYALRRLAAELESGQRRLLKGRCTFVPVCNERAFNEGRRFIEENLNRVFHADEPATSHERRVAAELVPLVDRCDLLLDLHSMQSEGEPFAFLNQDRPESEALCRSLGVAWIMKGWPELYSGFPDRLSSCTQTYADRRGKPNALIECGTNGRPEADAVAYRAAISAMVALGMMDDMEPLPKVEPKFLNLTDLYFREAVEDRFVKTWKNFEPVRAGDLIGHRGDGSEVRCPRDGFLVFPSPISEVGTEWFYVAVDCPPRK